MIACGPAAGCPAGPAALDSQEPDDHDGVEQALDHPHAGVFIPADQGSHPQTQYKDHQSLCDQAVTEPVLHGLHGTYLL